MPYKNYRRNEGTASQYIGTHRRGGCCRRPVDGCTSKNGVEVKMLVRDKSSGNSDVVAVGNRFLMQWRFFMGTHSRVGGKPF